MHFRHNVVSLMSIFIRFIYSIIWLPSIMPYFSHPFLCIFIRTIFFLWNRYHPPDPAFFPAACSSHDPPCRFASPTFRFQDPSVRKDGILFHHLHRVKGQFRTPKPRYSKILFQPLPSRAGAIIPNGFSASHAATTSTSPIMA